MSATATIRDFASQADYQACVQLQYDTWGKDFREAVPPAILLVAQEVGGVAAGAFDAAGRLLGFVFGITGVEDGRIVHWSDMLAVRPEARGTGIARDLKEYQRRKVAGVGGTVIYWTYDPLVARNAHLNFNVFGVRVSRYVRDMYGSDTGSDLHRGVGTDRLVVAWPVDDADLARRRKEAASARESVTFSTATILGDAEQPGAAVLPSAPALRIAVPWDLAQLQRDDPGAGARWRASTRSVFERALAEGYHVDGFRPDENARRGYYLLSRSRS
jgi:chorismate synthase